MDPLTILSAANAALTLAESLMPQIQAMQAGGQITVAQQAELIGRYNSLKAKADGQFAGPEWQQSGR